MSSLLYGKFRGRVKDNADPQLRCRILVEVPALDGFNIAEWAEPCVPVAGRNAGLVALPPIGGVVWIEFEQGDPSRPLWVGCGWSGQDQPPKLGAIAPNGSPVVIQSADGTRLSVSDLADGAGGFSVRSSSGAEIVMNADGIRLSNGQGAVLELIGTTVMVNGRAIAGM